MNHVIGKSIPFAFQIFILFSLCYCHNNSYSNEVKSNTKAIDIKIEKNDTLSIDSLAFSNEYSGEIWIDTNFSLKKGTMNLSHKTTKYNKYLLPIKYTEDSLNRKEIFFTETQIRLLKNNGELIKSIVITSKKIVDSCYGLDFQITQYGVLFLNKDDIEINNNKLILNYSFSIPFTDLGKAIKFSFDLVTFKEQVFIDP